MVNHDQNPAKWPKPRILRSCSLAISPDRCESYPGVENGQNLDVWQFLTIFGLEGPISGGTFWVKIGQHLAKLGPNRPNRNI